MLEPRAAILREARFLFLPLLSLLFLSLLFWWKYVARMSTNELRNGWTISDSEWDGFVKGCETRARKGAYVAPLFVIVPTVIGAALMLGADAWSRSSGGSGWLSMYGRVFWIAIVPFNIVITLRTAARLRRHARAVALVRAEDGCVCPTCSEACAPRTADGFAPRCRHGISRDAQPALIECWQAIARRDIYAVGRLNASLPASDAPRGIRARIQRVVLRAASTAADTERPFLQRYRAGLVSSLTFIPVILIMTGMPLLTGGPFLPTMTMVFAAGLFAAGPFFTMSGATRPTTQERCSACRQLLARVRPSRCSECGADLSRPAAIESIAQLKQWKYLGVGLVIVMLSFVGSMVVSLGIGFNMLPTPVLLAIAPYSDSSLTLLELERRTLSPTDRARLAQMLISRAAPRASLGGGFQPSPRSSNFVLPAVAAGELPASAIDDALRTMVTLDGAFKQTPEGADFVLTPRFGDNLFDRSGDAWVVFRGVSFDGGARIGASENPIDRWSIDPIWRSGFQRQSHPTEFAVPCPRTARTAVWSVTVVLLPFAQQPKFSLTADGELVMPTNTLRSIELEGTTRFDE
ncbi:MAG: hypothetical protein QM516_00550 [Limnohabitans sp.]|nr:hypothetical protein [Limnohabitans sp.]